MGACKGTWPAFAGARPGKSGSSKKLLALYSFLKELLS